MPIEIHIEDLIRTHKNEEMAMKMPSKSLLIKPLGLVCAGVRGQLALIEAKAAVAVRVPTGRPSARPVARAAVDEELVEVEGAEAAAQRAVGKAQQQQRR